MRFLSVFILMALLSAPAMAKNAVVLELFTTQLCNDAPPGDILFQKLLSEDADIIGISCHVESYNQAGGVDDILSKKFCDDRQMFYINTLDVGSSFVPLAVVNGKYEMWGADETLVHSAVAMARVEDAITPIEMQVEGAYLEFNLEARTLSEKADVWLFAYDDFHQLEPPAGTYGVRSEAYINAATHLVKLLSWDGAAKGFTFPLQDIEADGYVVLVQNAKDGVLAAGRVRHYPMSLAP